MRNAPRGRGLSPDPEQYTGRASREQAKTAPAREGGEPEARPPVVVGVMGSGSEEHRDLAEALGEWLAAAGFTLLTGGGGGVMAAASRAFHAVRSRRGVVVGILPGRPRRTGAPEPPPGYPNPWVEVAIRTHLPLSGTRGTEPMSRNHLNVLSAGVLVFLPGGAGTRSEVELAIRYGRPAVAYVGTSPERSDPSGGRLPLARTLAEVQAFVLGAAGGGNCA